jgi:hypothetical protein
VNREIAVQKGAVRIDPAEAADSIFSSADECVKLGARVLNVFSKASGNESIEVFHFLTACNTPSKSN